ncbi:conserved hypothetical protein [gamma proteobacterium NOR5-3]|nr:conserved hypothetical protein [gamma proteobacterium NOR5-3]
MCSEEDAISAAGQQQLPNLERVAPSTPRTAFIFLTRALTPRTRKLARRLRSQVNDRASFFVCGYDEQNSVHNDAEFNAHIYNRRDFDRRFSDCHCHYQASGTAWQPIPGRIDLVRIAFSMDHPEYDQVWVCEDDVRFTGDMGDLIAALESEDTDLLTPYLRIPAKNWNHLKTLQRNETVIVSHDSPRAFMPFCRHSRVMALKMLQEYRAGLTGHFEYGWPHVAHQHKLKLQDLNEAWTKNRGQPLYSACHNDSMRGRQSFVFRPAKFFAVWPRQTLFHPVKPASVVLKTRTKPFCMSLFWRVSEQVPRPVKKIVKQLVGL